jgi:hypothetical protein
MNTDLSCSEELETGQEQVGEVSSRVFISGGRNSTFADGKLSGEGDTGKGSHWRDVL